MNGYHLYQHRQDETVLIVARILEDQSYECRRYGSTSDNDTFTLDAETFLSIYKLSERAKS